MCVCTVVQCGRRTKGFSNGVDDQVCPNHLPVRDHQAEAFGSTCLNWKECCGAKTGMRASAQCVHTMINMRSARCLPAPSPSPLRPWSTRSHHAFGLPKLRRCFKNVSVSVRVFRSERLGKCVCIFFLYHYMDGELELIQYCQPLQSCHWLLDRWRITC